MLVLEAEPCATARCRIFARGRVRVAFFFATTHRRPFLQVTALLPINLRFFLFIPAQIRDAYGDRWSQMTVLILLSDNYEGGRTVFRVDGSEISTKTPKGGILVFPHGGHPQHCLHAGENVASGFKYMIRTEALYQRTPRAEVLQWRHMTNMMT